MSFKQSSKKPVIAFLFMYFSYLATTLRSRPGILKRLQLFFLKSPANGYMICYGMYGLLTERLHLCGRAWSEMLIINHCHAKPQKDYKNIDVEHEIIFVSEVNSFMVKTQVWFKQGTQSEKTKNYPLVDGIIKRNAEETPDGKRR